MSRFSTAFYEFTYWTLSPFLTFAFSLRVTGKQNVPRDGAVLFLANHQSFLDPPTIGVAVRRHISFLARKTLFKNPRFAFLLEVLNAVPIDQQGVGKEGIRNIIDKLKEGAGVLVFPEGERTWDGAMQKLKPGVALLLKKVAVPIVPVGIAGAFDAWPRTKPAPKFAPFGFFGSGRTVAVSIGKPRDPKSLAHLDRDEMLELLFRDIEAEWKRAEKLRSP